MTVPRYYVRADLDAGATGELVPEQARHFSKVLRRGVGDALLLFNGSGVEAVAAARSVSPKRVIFEVQSAERPDREPPISLTVGLALIKAGAFELAVQKLTEIGVSRIVPLEARRSVVSYPDIRDWERRAGRLTRIAIEAAEQSERVTVPDIPGPMPLVDFLQATSPVVLVERGSGEPLGTIDADLEMAITVGPEGGWSPEELDVIRATAGARPVTLGSLIYRAETAAIVAAGTLIQRAIAHREQP